MNSRLSSDSRKGSQHSSQDSVASTVKSFNCGAGLTTSSIFSVSFYVKDCIDLPGGQIYDPLLGKHYIFSSVPPSNSLVSVWALEGLFELTRRPSRALDLHGSLLPELQRYKDTVRFGALGAKVPGLGQQQLTQTLIVRLLKTHFFTSILDFEKSTE